MLWQVLIVEDDNKDRKKLIDGLKGFAQCTEALNGQQALKIYQNWRKKGKVFNFILLDVTMPEMDGFEVLKSIRAQEESYPPNNLKETHIIMITSYKDSLMKNYNMGWDYFITKPVDIKILIDQMQAMSTV